MRSPTTQLPYPTFIDRAWRSWAHTLAGSSIMIRSNTRASRLAFAMCCAGVLQACSGGGGGSAPPSPAPQPSADTTAPAIPGDVRTSSATDTSVTLAWDASSDTGGSGLAGYRVFRNGADTPLATI